MDRVDKYKRIEDDQQQGKGKAKFVPQEMRDFRSDRYNNNRLRRDYTEQQGSNNNQVVGAVFRIKSWKRLRTNPSSNGPIRWWEILKSETEISIVNTIETMVTLPRTAEVYGITWTNLSEKANWNNCCITPVVWVVRPILGRKGRILQDLLLELSTLFLRCLVERGHALLK